MAQQVNVKFVDDLGGSDAAGTVLFAIDGRAYEIDLSEDNAARLRESLASFVAAARKGGGAAAGWSPDTEDDRKLGRRPRPVDREPRSGHGPAERPPGLRTRRISKTVVDAFRLPVTERQREGAARPAPPRCVHDAVQGIRTEDEARARRRDPSTSAAAARRVARLRSVDGVVLLAAFARCLGVVGRNRGVISPACDT
jgi:hypothetical protein